MMDRHRAEGLDHFADHELMELLLYGLVPRADTNIIGHALVRRFGSFSGVLMASEEDLASVDGVSGSMAARIALFKDMFRIYEITGSARARSSPVTGTQAITPGRFWTALPKNASTASA